MLVGVRSAATNVIRGRVAADNTTSWRFIASDYTSHATLAAMASAGKTPWPNLASQPIENLFLRSDAGSGTDGSTFYICFNANDTAAPTDDTADDLVSGSGQTLVDLQVRTVAIRKLTGTDRIFLRGRY